MNKITIILLVFNCEKYLEESINSIINQTFKQWKLVVVNDGSTDKTCKILEKFNITLGQKILIIHNNKNLGINLSMNIALKYIDTPFFTRQDADDISDKFRLETLYNKLNYQNKYYFVSSRMRSLLDKNLVFPKKLIKFPNNLDMLFKFPFCNAPTLYNSKILNKVKGYNTSNEYQKRFEDYEFFYQLYLNGFKGFNINEVTYYARQGKTYRNKITFRDRIIEFKLKTKIYTNLKIPKIYFYLILLPLFKALIPLKILKL